MKVQREDGRFIDIYECRITAIHRQIPLTHNTWSIDITYKDHPEDVFHQNKTVHLSDSRFMTEMIDQYNIYKTYKGSPKLYDKCGILKFAYGGQDIDVYVRADLKGLLHIMWSPNSGLYVYFHMDAEEYEKLINILKQHLDESKPTGFFSIFSKQYKIVENR